MNREEIKQFQQEILKWYKQHQRDLPWRKDRDPYNILISEVMLQQTQVGRVIPKYKEWLQAFPSLATLAKASTHNVLRHWSGLGYNRRALYLQKFAQTIMQKFDGNIPQDEKELRKLPGIGEYTARALLCFAFDRQVTVVDTNIRKVVAVKFFAGKLPSEKKIQSVAQQLLPKGKAYEWNQALMDYSSAMLKEHKIPLAKQSTFKDSDRFFRGLTVRVLLEHTSLTFQKLLLLICQTKKIDASRYEKILLQMEKDGLIIQKGTKVMLPVG